MAWANGAQINVGAFYSAGVGNDTPFSEQINAIINAARGNYVLGSGVGAVIVGTNTDLTDANNHMAITTGNVLVGGNVVAMNTPSAAELDLNAHQPATDGESTIVLIYVNASGNVIRLSDTAVTDGDQEPPEIPENVCILAFIYLTGADDVISIDQIEDMRFLAPGGIYVDGDLVINGDMDYSGDSGLQFNLSIMSGIDITNGSDTTIDFGDDSGLRYFKLQSPTLTSVEPMIGFDLSEIFYMIKFLNPGKTITFTSIDFRARYASSSTNQLDVSWNHRTSGSNPTFSTRVDTTLTTSWADYNANLDDKVFAFGDTLELMFSYEYVNNNVDLHIMGIEINYSIT